jgi:hypothetical protein
MILMPTVRGVIRRRVLVNFRVDPGVVQRQLPKPFRPKLLDGEAIAGVCLIRLEGLRPRRLPAAVGLASENAAHRVAVEWDDADGRTRGGVYIPRRDSDSPVNRLLGGRLFPGEHHAARFAVREEAGAVDLAVRSVDGRVAVELRARPADALPSSSRFPSLAAASAFFEAGSDGYSDRRAGGLEGLRLVTRAWRVEPLAVECVRSSYFADARLFPPGAVVFDCALLMRDVEHEWHALPPPVASAEQAGAVAASSRQGTTPSSYQSSA